MLADPDAPEPNTLEEMEAWGTVDPVPYEYGYEDGDNNAEVSIKHGDKFLDLLTGIIDVDESSVEQWFGAHRNHIRDRAIMLVENGHINPSTLKVIKAKKKVQRGDVAEHLYLVEAKVVASQKSQWYLTRVALSERGELLCRPYSSCECVVRRGQACSHQLAVLLYAMAVKILMQRLPSTAWRDVRPHLPDHIVVLQKMPVSVKYAYGHGSMNRFAGISQGHMKALLKLGTPAAPQPPVQPPTVPQPPVQPPTVPQPPVQPPTAPQPPPAAGNRRRRRPKPVECCYQERCTSVGHEMVTCAHESCDNKCHAFCGRMFSGDTGDVVCPLHIPRVPTYDTKMRNLTKHVTHLPVAWVQRWASERETPGRVLNEARLCAQKIREDTQRELSYFPRDLQAQYQCDLSHERDFALVAAGKLPKDDLWCYFLIHTRKNRLKRMQMARRQLQHQQVPAATSPDRAGQRVSRVSKLRAMLPGMYVVTSGPDKHDRLVVRCVDGVFDGYYVHQHEGSLTPKLDQFSIQVGSKGSCTLLPGAIATGARSISKTEKQKLMWVLNRSMSNDNTLVWQRRLRTLRMQGGKRGWVNSGHETIQWKRSTDEMLFAGRSAPRTPPAPLLVSTPHKAPVPSDKGKRACACGHPDCNKIAAAIGARHNVSHIQANLVRRSVRPIKRSLMTSSPGDSPNVSAKRPKRRQHDAESASLQSQLNEARTEGMNRIRHQNAAKALRGSALDTAVFNVACHYPVKFCKRVKRKATTMMSTSVHAWGIPPAKQIKLLGIPHALCVPQMECDDAERRWDNVSSASSSSSAEEPAATTTTCRIKFNDNIRYVQMDGNVQPSNWSGLCKYNFMNDEHYIADPGLCKRYFGYPGTFEELVWRITESWFPYVEPKRSGMAKTDSLTELEEILATLYFMKNASPSCDQKQLGLTWGISKKSFVCMHAHATTYMHSHCHIVVCRCQRILKKWSERLEAKAKEYCILDLREEDDFFKWHQPADFGKKYGCCIECELDGTVTKHDKSRKHSVKARCSYCDKCKHQAAQGLTWTSVIGLVLLCTTMWCGRTSEKALVRLYRSWLTIFSRCVLCIACTRSLTHH